MDGFCIIDKIKLWFHLFATGEIMHELCMNYVVEH